jgi:hypothetical protein
LNLEAESLHSAWRTYCLFGLILQSDYPFANCLTPGEGPSDVTFTCVTSPPLLMNWETSAPVYQSHYRTDEGDSRFYFYRLDGCDILRFTRIVDYYMFPDRILAHPSPTCEPLMIEGFLLGAALALRLESQVIPALHASAVVCRGQAVGFLSNAGNGKSTLAAALIQDGCTLLSDDILPVQRRDGKFVGHPGFPQMRLWPREAQNLLGHYEDLARVWPGADKRRVPIGLDGFGSFCSESRPLACLYVPERRDPAEFGAAIEIEPIAPRQAVIELVRYSFTAFIMEALGWQAQRLKLFAGLVRQVPMRRLIYPSGLEHLPRVREAILNDVGVFSGGQPANH